MASIRFGVMAMAYSLFIMSFLSQIINSFPNKKLLGYGYVEQIKDILPSIILAVGMGFIISVIKYFRFSDFVTLLIQIPLGALIYVGGSKVLHFDSYEYLKHTFFSMMNKSS